MAHPDMISRSRIENLIQNGKHEEALVLLTRVLAHNPVDRECRLYLLLINAQLGGPERYEEEIDAIRSLPKLDPHEKKIVRRIFRLGLIAAEQEERLEAADAYRSLLRSLDLKKPLTRPIPLSRRNPSVLHDITYVLGFEASDRRFILRYAIAKKIRAFSRYFSALIAAGIRSWKDRSPARGPGLRWAAVFLLLSALGYGYLFYTFRIEAPPAVTVEKRLRKLRAPNFPASIDQPQLQIAATVAPAKPAEIPAVPPTAAAGAESPDGNSEKSAAAFVAREQSRQAPAEVNPSRMKVLFVYRTRRPIALRTKPSFSSAIVQRMEQDSKIDVLELKGNWLKVRTRDRGKVGFVRREFTDPVSPQPE